MLLVTVEHSYHVIANAPVLAPLLVFVVLNAIIWPCNPLIATIVVNILYSHRLPTNLYHTTMTYLVAITSFARCHLAYISNAINVSYSNVRTNDRRWNCFLTTSRP